MSLYEVLNLFPRWPLVLRSFLHPPLVARDVVTPKELPTKAAIALNHANLLLGRFFRKAWVIIAEGLEEKGIGAVVGQG